MRLNIRSALVCDQVRTENNGKQILIGVYPGDIIFNLLPVKFAPTFWVDFILDAAGNTDIEVKIDVPGRTKPLKANTVVIGGDKQSLMVLTGPPFEITQVGLMVLSMRLKGGRWQRVISKEVQLKEPTDSSKPSPFSGQSPPAA